MKETKKRDTSLLLFSTIIPEDLMQNTQSIRFIFFPYWFVSMLKLSQLLCNDDITSRPTYLASDVAVAAAAKAKRLSLGVSITLLRDTQAAVQSSVQTWKPLWDIWTSPGSIHGSEHVSEGQGAALCRTIHVRGCNHSSGFWDKCTWWFLLAHSRQTE